MTPPAASEQSRGLEIVEALSAHWGWRDEDGGKAVFVVLAREASPIMAEISDLPMLHDMDSLPLSVRKFGFFTSTGLEPSKGW